MKLPPFWPTNPAAWFATVKRKFFHSGIDDEPARFYNCLQALPEATVILISDLLEANLLPAASYTALQAHLMTSDQLTNIQHVEMLLGIQKPSEPSELLA